MIRIVAAAAVGAFIAGTAGGWIAHSTWTDAQQTDRLEAAIRKAREDTRKQVKAEYEERLRKQRDALLVTQARKALRAGDRNWDHCPSVPGDFGRMLNRIGEDAPAPELADEVRGTAPSS